MDGASFDRLSRIVHRLSHRTTRRQALRALAVGGVAGLLTRLETDDARAGCKRYWHRCSRDGECCGRFQCRNGRCRPRNGGGGVAAVVAAAVAGAAGGAGERRAVTIGPVARSAVTTNALTATTSSVVVPAFARGAGIVAITPAALRDGNVVVMGAVVRTVGTVAIRPVMTPETRMSRRSRPRASRSLSQ